MRLNTLGDYINEVMVTCRTTKPREVQGLVLTAGLCGEAGEFYEAMQNYVGQLPSASNAALREFRDKAIKELGDFLWYTAALWSWTGLGALGTELETLQHLAPLSDSKEGCDLMLQAAGVAELMKKHVGHDKPFDRQAFETALSRCLVGAAVAANDLSADLAEVCEANIAKLRARFQGGGFSAALANAPRSGS